RRQLPEVSMAPWIATQEAVALRDWHLWQAKPSMEGLQDFCGDYGTTRPGTKGWIALAVLLRDHQRWNLAEAAWQKVLNHPAASKNDRSFAQSALELVSPLVSFPKGNSVPNSDVSLTQPAATIHTRLAANSRWSQPLVLSD